MRRQHAAIFSVRARLRNSSSYTAFLKSSRSRVEYFYSARSVFAEAAESGAFNVAIWFMAAARCRDDLWNQVDSSGALPDAELQPLHWGLRGNLQRVSVFWLQGESWWSYRFLGRARYEILDHGPSKFWFESWRELQDLRISTSLRTQFFLDIRWFSNHFADFRWLS